MNTMTLITLEQIVAASESCPNTAGVEKFIAQELLAYFPDKKSVVNNLKQAKDNLAEILKAVKNS